MKKLLLLPLAFFLLCQLVFAQSARMSGGQKKSSSFLDKIQSKAPTLKGENHQSPFRDLGQLPTPNSFWQPGKMIESSWDTISSSWVFNDSILYSYNVNGDVTLELYYYTSSGLSEQTIYTYNANAKLTQVLGQSWNGSSWDNGWKNSSVYDANNNLIQWLAQSWNTSTSSWDNSYQMLYAYDANNNQIQYIFQMWNTSTSSWDNQWKDDYTYNVSNQMIQFIEQSWNGASWDNSFKEDFTYNGSGVLTDLIAYQWNVSTWEIYAQLINIVWYQWNGDLNTSLLQSYLEQDWNGTAYVDAYRETYTYDAQGNTTDDIYEEWQTSAWVILYDTKNIYAYDANNNISQDIIQDWVPWMMAVRNSWKIDYSNYNLYSGVIESSSANDNILAYPNPSTGKIQVISNQYSVIGLEVYNVFGEKVFTSTINHQPSTIDISSQPNGVYFLQLKTGQGIANKKIVISH